MFFFQEAFGSPMVVNYLHLFGATVFPDEDDTPLLIDSDAVKSFQVSRKRFKPVARRGSQGIQGDRCVEQVQLPYRHEPDRCRNASCLARIASVEQVQSPSVAERIIEGF